MSITFSNDNNSHATTPNSSAVKIIKYENRENIIINNYDNEENLIKKETFDKDNSIVGDSKYQNIKEENNSDEDIQMNPIEQEEQAQCLFNFEDYFTV